jgi:hypothetical protein
VDAPPQAATVPGPPTPYAFEPAPQPTAPVGHHPAPGGTSSRTAWLVVALVAGLLVLAGGVYVAVAGLPWASESVAPSGGAPGKLPAGDPPATGSDDAPPAAGSEGAPPTAGTEEPPPTVAVPEGNPPLDPSRVGPLQPVSVTATCQAPPSVDSVGNTITYEPQLTLDAVDGTAWRCAGSAVGQRLVFDFVRPVTLASMGLIPGYAKIDPADGTDRFSENRTVTSVVWWFDDGTAQAQTIPSPAPTLASVRLPAGATTSQVVLEIIGTGNDGAVRDFTAISEVRFTGY